MMRELIIRTITGIIFGIFFWAVLVYLPPRYSSLMLLGILLQIIFFEIKKIFNFKKVSSWVLVSFYPILPFGLLIYMNHFPSYQKLLFILFIIVFSHDTGAYIVGKLIGKHKIVSSISPGKTWEGFVGGYIFSCIGLAWILWELGITKTWIFICIFALFVCILSLLGDLFESWLKRRAHIKDSGSILPGHGGFLDRFDGILFAVFFFFLFKDYLIILFNI